MASLRKMWACKNTQCKNEAGKHRGYKKVCTGEKQALCKHCGVPMVLNKAHTVRITRDGQSVTRTVGTNKSDAEAMLAQMVIARKTGALMPGEERLISWADAVKVFEDDMEDRIARGKSADTVTYYRSCLKTLTAAFCRKSLQNITDYDVTTFMQTRAKNGAGNSIVNGNLAVLKILYKLACKRYKIRQHPRLHEAYQEIFAVERFSKPPRREIILTQEECDTLLSFAAGNRTLHHFIYGTLNTGLRHGDMLKITSDNISQESIKALTKGNKWVTIPLTDGYRSYLKEWLAVQKVVALRSSKWIFPDPRKPGECLNVRSQFGWDGLCRKVAEHYSVLKQKESAAKFRSLVPHHLRHTFATHYLYKTSTEHGMTVAVFQLSGILGHSTEHITKTYLHSLSDIDVSAMQTYGAQMFGNNSVTA